MTSVAIERGVFWEFKGRCAVLDLELAKVRSTMHALTAERNALVDAFAKQHGLDPAKPIALDDEALTVTQA